MTRLWIRNLTSRKDSRTGPWDIRRWFGAGGAALPDVGACGAAFGIDGPDGTVDPGRALSIRFRRDIDYFPSGSVADVDGR
jgi:hypothetical protein